MAERGSAFDLEETLRDVGSRLAYPASADLRPAVLARIEQGHGRGLMDLFRSPLSLAPAVATLVLLLVTTLAFQPVASSAAEALGLRGISLFRVPEPARTPGPAGPVFPADAYRVVSVEEASRDVGFAVKAPAALGHPDAIFVRRTDGAAMAFLYYGVSGIPVFASDPAFVLITEIRGSLEAQLLGKILPPGTTAEELEVNGGRGFWIEGEPHELFYRSPSGEILTDTVRLAGNVLLWEQDGLLMRIEAQVGRDQAQRIARSMR
ncbi:MAG: hypothetical protein ACRDGT_07565 [Candidatus Limnocylindria bacterium]